MFRKLLGTMLVLGALAGCSSRMGECQSDGDCQRFGEQALCEPTTKQCFVRDAGVEPEPEPEVDGGTCQFQCAEYQACTVNGCANRYTGLSFVTPTSGAVFDGGTAVVPVTARLERASTYASTTTFPTTLTFSASGPDGEPGGTFAAVSASDGGTYTTEWTPPVAEGDFVLTAAYPVAGGPTGTVSVRVDKVPPALNVTVAEATTQVEPNGFTYEDPQQQQQSYRRDETARVTVDSSSADLDPASIQFVVQGIGGSDITDLPLVDCVPLTAPFCKTVDVPLWRPAFNAFRGNFTVRVTVKDRVGNPVTVTRTIPVTRWLWAFDGKAGDIRASPAIGDKGMVYIGTSNTNGQVFALSQNGTKAWERALGSVVSSPAVGRVRSGDEYLYVGSTDSNGAARLYALQGGTGNVVERCPDSNPGLGGNLIESAVGLGSTTVDQVGAVETAVAIYNSSSSAARMVGLRPDAAQGDRCINLSGAGGVSIPPSTVGNSLVVSGENFFYGTSDKRLASYVINANSARTNWPLSTTVIARGLALLDDAVYGAAASTDDPDSGGLFTAPQTVPAGTSSVTYFYPSTTPASRVFNLAIGKERIAYFGAEVGASASLVRSDLSNPTTPQTASSPAGFRAAPVLGVGGLLYTVNADGDVSSWTADGLVQRWTVELELSTNEASPTLDCLRDATGAQVMGSPVGVLYVPAGTRLHAFIVDSPRLDLEAPWPKYQHDARNSGNPATPITSCQ